ncbi:DeoR/GlpR family DNA-binding transcription regulator [Tengunoibacter tsumagoiensis]|uniref:GntR family transcriptional regulator n=1 Tax=Tengunoibacter tsumagoiensis TaxID=2014871 RepID=A0A402A3N7_9CHLR|nr:DeoR/GlpR family DNA-binding transcription regulator [Tengunoibacter tsumagoiensis]GCE13760.1 GntR family transcriptional regulator [Tengunoibacter tsumagoiensis]
MSHAAQRAEYILQQLLLHGRVDAEQLSQQLEVNASTIRRDLERMERQNLLRRIHGGALPVDMLAYSAYSYGLTFQENMSRQVEEKTQIARIALQLIQPGDTIALSPGTTTTHLARAIRQSRLQPLTVVTNAVNIAMELSGLPGITLTLTGGLLLPDFFALVGPLAEQSLNQVFVAKAFIGVTGLSAEYGLTGPNQLESLSHRLTMQRAQRTIVLADATKLGSVALHAIAPITTMHILVTDQHATEEQLTPLRTLGIDIYQPTFENAAHPGN